MKVIIYYFKEQNKKVMILKFFLFLLLFITQNYVLGATEVSSGGGDGTTATWASPQPNLNFIPGSKIRFMIGFRVSSCGDGLFNNRVQIYITEDKDFPLKTINKCSIKQAIDCDKVQGIDFLAGKSKLLADFSLPDTTHDFVSFDVKEIIPQDFTGPVRFYVQWSGTHWQYHWHWWVGYEKGIVTSQTTVPICGNGICEVGEDCNNCSKDCGQCVSVCTPGTKKTLKDEIYPDVYISDFQINTYVCGNRLNPENYPQYPYPSSTAFNEYKALLSCPESQRNRPVEFVAKSECRPGLRIWEQCEIDMYCNISNCTTDCPDCKETIPCSETPPGKIKVEARSTFSSVNETFRAFSNILNLSIPQTFKALNAFNNPVDYTAEACVVDQNGLPYQDSNPTNNCRTQTLRIYDYYCFFSFCAQGQVDPNNSQVYKNKKIFGTTDAPCRYWRNEVCRAIFRY